MCIIDDEIVDIANTNILCSLSKDKKRQLIVYSNIIDNELDTNAMILPVPNPETLQFHNLENYKHIFDDCEKCFEEVVKEVVKLSVGYDDDDDDKILKVFNVGSYSISVANNLKQLKSIDKNIFTLSPELCTFLPEHYPELYFGFIICKLNKGSEKYHPLAYSHNIEQSQIFIPTKHYHKHKLHDGKTEEWSHNIYLYNVFLPFYIEKLQNKHYRWIKEQKTFELEKIDFDFDKCKFFHNVCIHGDKPNIDLLIKVS